MLRQLAKKVVPPRCWDALKSSLAERKLDAAIRTLISTETFTDGAILEFREAWGNQGFSADNGFIAHVARVLLDRPGDVLECGSGATTVLAAIIGKRHGFGVYSLEQDAQWKREVLRTLTRHQLARATVIAAPIGRLHDYAWYELPSVELPRHFATVICDGPYIADAWASPVYENWRYGILPWLHTTGRTFDQLLLDDFDDTRCAPVLKRWEREFGVSSEIRESAFGAHAILRPAA